MKTKSEKIYDVIVIGGGPAGMISAITSCIGTPMNEKEKLSEVLILEKNKLGGIAKFAPLYLTKSWMIPGQKLTTMLQKEIEDLKIKVKTEEKVISFKNQKSLKEVITNKNRYWAKFIIIACGIFPYPEYLGKANVHLIVERSKQKIDFFKNLETKNKIRLNIKKIINKINITKPILIVGQSPEVFKTEKFIKKLAPFQKTNVIWQNPDQLKIKDKNFKKIIFDYNSYKNIPANSKDFQETGLRINSGYIETNRSFETNIKGIFACGNIVSETSGILQASYSAFMTGLKVRELVLKEKFKKKSNFFPWVKLSD